ncbi:MAG: M20/M25/M40 family metallo-hydrolase [Deltaproteobacteria bacterium]|nr:M20/M25/M40 family metallo-hydrolase [Deltaproteobacteria bacterium]
MKDIGAHAGDLKAFVEQRWEESILPELEAYIAIPNLSPHFDPDWAEHGHMEKATEHIHRWCAEQAIEGMSLEVVRLDGRTPVIFMEIEASGGGSNEKTVLLYGHLDKQPEMSGWDADKGPWKPVRQDGKLYGRGGADDGYAAYASLTAIAALQRQGLPHDRCVVLIEACEESGSFDLPPYLEHLKARIGTPYLVVCLDSGCGDYERLWGTTSLRGLVGGTLKVENLKPTADGSAAGVHSGDSGGIVPSAGRLVRLLLARLEDTTTGEIQLDALKVAIPDDRREQAEQAAQILGDGVWQKYPFADGAEPMAAGAEAILNRTWRPILEVVGTDAPDLRAGNVLRGRAQAKLSIRIPPHVNPEEATAAIKSALESDPPKGAAVTFEPEQGAAGWEAPTMVPWLEQSLTAASEAFFGHPAAFQGEGGTIPFMGMLGEMFPEAQFVITGLLGPGSNAHGPNEFLHIDCAKKLTASMAAVLVHAATRD